MPAYQTFVGLQIVAVDDLGTIVYFRFADAARGELKIGVESEWVIQDAHGTVVASGLPNPKEPIGEPPLRSIVVAAETEPPRAIVLRLASGQTIKIIDNSDRYESFCIPHANVYI